MSTQAIPDHSRIAPRQAQDLVIGDGNGFADALGRIPGLALQAIADHRERDVGGLLARRVPADAVDHQEDAALGIAMNAVLVVGPHPPGIAFRGALQPGA